MWEADTQAGQPAPGVQGRGCTTQLPQKPEGIQARTKPEVGVRKAGKNWKAQLSSQDFPTGGLHKFPISQEEQLQTILGVQGVKVKHPIHVYKEVLMTWSGEEESHTTSSQLYVLFAEI